MTFEGISSFDHMSTTTNEIFGLFYNAQKNIYKSMNWWKNGRCT